MSAPWNVGPDDGLGVHDIHSYLHRLRKCLEGPGAAIDTDDCNNVLQEIARGFHPDHADANLIGSPSVASFTLDVLGELRMQRDVAALTALSDAENAAARCALRLWKEHAALPHRLVDVEKIARRAVILWHRGGDDTRQHMIAHIESLAHDYFSGRGQILDAIDGFFDSIRARYDVSQRPTHLVQTQLCLLVQLWYDLAQPLAHTSEFADDFSARARGILDMIERLRLPSFHKHALVRFMSTIRRVMTEQKDEASREELRPRLLEIATALGEWHDRLSEEKDNHLEREQLRKVLDSYQAYVHGREGYHVRPVRRRMLGAEVELAFPSLGEEFHQAHAIDACQRGFRGVALKVPSLECLDPPEARSQTGRTDDGWATYSGRLRFMSMPLDDRRVHVRLRYPDDRAMRPLTCDGLIVRAWAGKNPREDAGIVCYIDGRTASDPGWRDYILRQHTTSD